MASLKMPESSVKPSLSYILSKNGFIIMKPQRKQTKKKKTEGEQEPYYIILVKLLYI